MQFNTKSTKYQRTHRSSHCITLSRTPIRDVGVSVQYKFVFRCSIVLAKIYYGVKKRPIRYKPWPIQTHSTVKTVSYHGDTCRLSRPLHTVNTLPDWQDSCKLSLKKVQPYNQWSCRILLAWGNKLFYYFFVVAEKWVFGAFIGFVLANKYILALIV